MRLGGWYAAETIEELEPLCEKLDRHGLSAIGAPYGLGGFTDDQCAAFGAKADELGIVIGEVGMWDNLMVDDHAQRDRLIGYVRTLLQKAEIMGCRCVVTLVGSKDAEGGAIAPHPYMSTDACKAEFREIVLRTLDGLDLKRTGYGIEPWCNTFFYQPEEIRAFIDYVDHPRFGLHLDQMNMVCQAEYFQTTELINRTFDLLADKALSVHFKDVRWDPGHMLLKLDEVLIGEGVMDYDTFVSRLPELPPDITCFCEHLMTEDQYVHNFARLHEIAARHGLQFLPRRAAGAEA